MQSPAPSVMPEQQAAALLTPAYSPLGTHWAEVVPLLVATPLLEMAAPLVEFVLVPEVPSEPLDPPEPVAPVVVTPENAEVPKPPFPRVPKGLAGEGRETCTGLHPAVSTRAAMTNERFIGDLDPWDCLAPGSGRTNAAQYAGTCRLRPPGLAPSV